MNKSELQKLVKKARDRDQEIEDKKKAKAESIKKLGFANAESKCHCRKENDFFYKALQMNKFIELKDFFCGCESCLKLHTSSYSNLKEQEDE